MTRAQERWLGAGLIGLCALATAAGMAKADEPLPFVPTVEACRDADWMALHPDHPLAQSCGLAADICMDLGPDATDAECDAAAEDAATWDVER